MLDMGEDPGYVLVKLGGAEIKLDLWQVSNELSELTDSHRGKPPSEWLAAVLDYVRRLGFPEVSSFAARQFAAAVWARAAELKNSAAGGTPGASPASTASTPTP